MICRDRYGGFNLCFVLCTLLYIKRIYRSFLAVNDRVTITYGQIRSWLRTQPEKNQLHESMIKIHVKISMLLNRKTPLLMPGLGPFSSADNLMLE